MMSIVHQVEDTIIKAKGIFITAALDKKDKLKEQMFYCG